MDSEIYFLVYLHSIGFSQKKLASIFREKQNYREVFESISEGYLAKEKFLPKQRESILEKYHKINPEFIKNKIEKENIQLITIFDDDYPSLLREIANPPFIIYIKGKLPKGNMLAVVGSRNISSYGKKCIRNILPELLDNFVVVSGGAAGCDSEAHEVTLSVGGKTIVVVGTGIDVVYPRSNVKLFQEVIQKGSCILSIFPLGEPGNAYNFPQRNEIISGLSQGTLVIEAGEKSGTLITAQLTLDQGRELFAIQGDIDKQNSTGCNILIKKGEAKIVTESMDILEEFSFAADKNKARIAPPLNERQKNIYDTLLQEVLFFDEILEKTSLSISELTGEISMMEIQSIIQKNKEGKYEIF